MDSGYAWILIAALAGGVVVLFDVGRRTARQRRQQADPTLPPDVDEIYAGLRLSALTATLETVGLVAKGEGAKAFGLVIDVGLGKGIATLSTLITGDASLFASDGGGTLGGIDEPDIKAAAVTAIKRAETVIPAMSPTKAFPLPASGQATFYLLLSNRSVVTAEDSIARLVSGESVLSPAWDAAHMVFERFGVTAFKSPA